jgi:cyclopropane fatty-acyl-phospholipid synthase-like methyltransferase
MNKPYAESCDQNKQPILEIIMPILATANSVLEIGSGTGQHAVYFAGKMPHLTWYTSDCLPYIEGINMWLQEAELTNVVAPVELNVTTSPWPDLKVDAVFTANSLHIMGEEDVIHFMACAGQLLKPQGELLIYGPFNYNGKYTSESNRRFDQWLKSRDINSGIKSFENLSLLAADNGMQLVSDYTMPANNRILHFRKN